MSKAIFTAFVFLSVMIHTSGQTTLSPGSDIRNHTDSKGMKQGFWEKKFPNGNPQYRGYFKNDKPVGEFTRFYEGGAIQAIQHFDESGIVCHTLFFYENGEKAAEGKYIGTKKDSVWKYYSFYSRSPIASETYKDGVLHGISHTYYESGNPSQELHWHKGVKHGGWKIYFESGKTKLQGEFFNNMKNGPFVYYFPDGSVDFRGSYLYDMMDGKWEYYDKAGKIIGTVEYVNGKPVNESELIEKEQELFKLIERSRGKIPEPEESGGFFR